MSFETLIIIFLSSLLLILVIIQFFFSNTGSKERIKILLEKQESLEKKNVDKYTDFCWKWPEVPGGP